MKPSSAKAKGRRLQKEIVELFNPILQWYRGKKTVVEPIGMGQSGADIVVHPLVAPHFPFAVEAKNQERFSIWAACEQAEFNAGELIPIVVFRRNHTKPRVVIGLDDFAGIFEALHQCAADRQTTVKALIDDAKTTLQESRS